MAMFTMGSTTLLYSRGTDEYLADINTHISDRIVELQEYDGEDDYEEELDDNDYPVHTYLVTNSNFLSDFIMDDEDGIRYAFDEEDYDSLRDMATTYARLGDFVALNMILQVLSTEPDVIVCCEDDDDEDEDSEDGIGGINDDANFNPAGFMDDWHPKIKEAIRANAPAASFLVQQKVPGLMSGFMSAIGSETPPEVFNDLGKSLGSMVEEYLTRRSTDAS